MRIITDFKLEWNIEGLKKVNQYITLDREEATIKNNMSEDFFF